MNLTFSQKVKLIRVKNGVKFQTLVLYLRSEITLHFKKINGSK